MSYVSQVLQRLEKKNAHQAEFLQAAREVLTALTPVVS